GFTVLGVSAIPEKSVRGDCLLVHLWISLLRIKKVTTHRINQTAFENRWEDEKVVERIQILFLSRSRVNLY
ncbi:hypothetical protein PanWU01x14_013130, partial [Parasponia andersonii]